MQEDKYQLMNRLTSAQSLLQDVENKMLSAALAGSMSPERKRDILNKLDWTKSTVEGIPTEEG